MGYRLLLYCQDSLGLGHLRRATNIAWRVHEIDPTAEVLITADSPVAPFFAVPPGCQTIKLPTLVKISAGRWASPLDRVVRLGDIRSFRVALLRSIAEAFRPDAVLIDHMAQGAMRELEPTIEALRRRRGVHLVLGLRDILGDADVINRQWTSEGVNDLIKRSYDRILIYGCQDVFDLPTAQHFDREMRQKTTFCGYIAPKIPADLTPPTSSDPSILVMAGGGHDGYRLMDATIRSLDHLSDPRRLKITMLTGPFIAREEARQLRSRARRHAVSLERMQPDTLAATRSAHLVVSMCGYNTMAEVLAMRKRALVVPRLGPSAEQRMRARLFDEHQLIDAVFDRELAAHEFAARLERAWHRPSRTHDVLPVNGGLAAARALLQREAVVQDMLS